MSNLKQAAQAALKANPYVEKVYTTSDGNAFLNKNHADLHSNTNRTGKKLKITTFTAAELKSKPTPKPNSNKPSVEDRVKSILKLDTADKVDAALKGETSKQVKEAAVKRLVELKAATTATETGTQNE